MGQTVKKANPKRYPTIVKRRELRALMAATQDKALNSHLRTVRKVALTIARKIKQKRINIDWRRTISAAELHDMAMLRHQFYFPKSSRDLKKAPNHEKVAGQILRGMGYIKTAKSVERHAKLLSSKNVKRDFDIEDLLVIYADTVCKGDKIVGLDEKIKYDVKKYGNKRGNRIFIENRRLKAFETEMMQQGIDLKAIVEKLKSNS